MPDNLTHFTCPDCGKSMLLSKHGRRLRCPDCARAHQLEADRQKMRRRRANRKNGNRYGVPIPYTPRGQDELIRLSQQARAAGLSYGRYIALQKEGKA